LGAIRHREQHYNLQGANAYLSLIIPLAVLSMVLPDFTETTPGPMLSYKQEMVLALMAVGLYGVFLAVQTGWYHGYFELEHAGPAPEHPAPRVEKIPVLPHVLLLIGYLAPIVYLADHLAKPIDYMIETLKAPVPLG